MNTRPPLPSGSPGEDDSWESLAKNLFGIDFAEAPPSGEIVPPEELDEDEPPSASRPEESQPAGEESRQPGSEPEPASQPGSKTEPTDEAFAEGVEPAAGSEPSPPAVEVSEGSGDRDERSGPQDDEGPPDPYWDALDQFGEDVEPTEATSGAATSDRAGAGRGPSADVSPQPPSRDADAPAQRPAARDSSGEELDDPEFGAGILEDEPLPARAETVSEKTEDQADEQTRGTRRRKRVRRRRRGASRETGETKETELHEEEGETWEEVSEEKSEDAPGSREGGTRGRRSRRRSSRRRRRSTESAPEKSAARIEQHDEPDDGPDDEEDSDWDEEESGEEATSGRQPKYRKVPTWEEAISYLLDRPVAESRRQKEGTGGGSSSKSKSSSKSSGRRGRRRRRS